jgi:hypothetical protein
MKNVSDTISKNMDLNANLFITPPKVLEAGVWWRWIDGNVSRQIDR